MSFLDDIVDFGKNIWNTVSGSGVIGGAAKATALGFLLKQVTNSINKDNQKPETATTNTPDPGVRLQVNPNTDSSIPVVYGEAFLGGCITDAAITNSNQTMWYCITICEKTGNLLNGTASAITVEDIYWDSYRVAFQQDGITVASFIDQDNNVNTLPNGLIKFYVFSGNSTSPSKIRGYANGNSASAYSLFPNWTSNHTMSDLIFVLVRVDYNKANDVTKLGDIQFKIKNTMTLPGDVLYDYMTNTRYGAGIDEAEIKTV